MSQENTSPILDLISPKPIMFILTVSTWFFAIISTMTLLLYSHGKLEFWIPLLFMGFTVLSVCAFVLMNVQTLVGQSKIIRRSGFRLFIPDQELELQDIAKIEITWLQFLRLTSRNNKVLNLSFYPPSLMTLPPCQENFESSQLEGLYRLKEEIERRILQSDVRFLESDQKFFDKCVFEPFQFLTFFIPGLLLFSLTFGSLYRLHMAGVSKLHTTAVSEIRFADITDAFFLFQGPHYEQLKNQFVENCRRLQDQNCRIAGFFMRHEGRPKEEENLFSSLSCKNPSSPNCGSIDNRSDSETIID